MKNKFAFCIVFLVIACLFAAIFSTVDYVDVAAKKPQPTATVGPYPETDQDFAIVPLSGNQPYPDPLPTNEPFQYADPENPTVDSLWCTPSFNRVWIAAFQSTTGITNPFNHSVHFLFCDEISQGCRYYSGSYDHSQVIGNDVVYYFLSDQFLPTADSQQWLIVANIDDYWSCENIPMEFNLHGNWLSILFNWLFP